MTVQGVLYMFTASFLALFPVMNPVGNGFIVNSFLGGLDTRSRRNYAKRIMVNALMVGLGSLALGHLVLLLFGLAVPVIQIAGGILIGKTGLDLLSGSDAVLSEDREQVDSVNPANLESRLFYPITFPISIGPGSISVIFTLMATAVGDNILHTAVNYAVIGLVILLLCVILYVFLTQGDRITGRISSNGNMIINKMVAFITFCIGLQIFFTGIGKAFHITVL
ncbi:MAG: MarC family protein [Rikenellaceae bacterium]|nr:MarC family protein [Rikenellaceae bacterium]